MQACLCNGGRKPVSMVMATKYCISIIAFLFKKVKGVLNDQTSHEWLKFLAFSSDVRHTVCHTHPWELCGVHKSMCVHRFSTLKMKLSG